MTNPVPKEDPLGPLLKLLGMSAKEFYKQVTVVVVRRVHRLMPWLKPEDCEDLAHDILVVIVHMGLASGIVLSSLNVEGRRAQFFKLLRVIVDRKIGAMKRKARFVIDASVSLESICDEADTDSTDQSDEDTALLRDAIEKAPLTSRRRLIISMKWHGLAYQEMSMLTGLSIAQLRLETHRAITQIRHYLDHGPSRDGSVNDDSGDFESEVE